VRVQDLFAVRGKTVVVTGGSAGIGQMIATGFVEAGARVYVASRKLEECRKVAAELSRAGECSGIAADLSSEAGCRALADEIARREGQLHVLVNNAGANWGAPFDDFPDSAWDKVLALNVKAVFHLTRASHALLDKASLPGDPARVINVGSIDGLHVPALETYAYSTSKAAVHHLTRVLARRLAPTITVNAIAPGPFQSRMMRATLERFGEGIKSSVPLKRIGEPEDMAGVALYLASRAGAWVTGVVIPVDGGMSTCL
jgi:NAD(P)-dependent dehydrogenase (short-subunit alcohol dehydrogenase family)